MPMKFQKLLKLYSGFLAHCEKAGPGKKQLPFFAKILDTKTGVEMDKRILIVDDEVDLCEILGFLFESDKWIVQTASNGVAALQLVDSFSPHVILSDINMPDMDGLQLLETLFNKNLDIPVILLTGFRDNQKMQKAWMNCAYDFMDKPFKKDELIMLANNAFKFGADYVRFARKRYNK